MRQYLEVREKLPPKTLLLFRLGDFYELFMEDAEEASRILGLTLTQRSGMPMAGIPHHAINGYLRKILDSGWKVAVCDQLEPACSGRIVRRALTRIYTPGTMLEEDHIDAKSNHYLLAFDVNASGIHAAWLELSTGQLCMADHDNVGELLAILSALDPREVLIPENAGEAWKSLNDPWLEAFQMLSTRRLTSEIPSFYFDRQNGLQLLRETLGVFSLDGHGISEKCEALGAAGALLYYATQNLCHRPQNIHGLRQVKFSDALLLDGATLRNLEIFQSIGGTREGSLLQAIDRTETAPGARLLQQYLSQPLLSLEEIRRRQECVQAFYDAPDETLAIRWHLRHTKDLLRMLGRVQNRLRNPRELGGILATLQQLPKIRQQLASIGKGELEELAAQIGDFSDLTAYLRRALGDELPNDLNDGGYIRDGFHEKLDSYRQLLFHGHRWLADWEAEEQRKTGIRNLRIKYNGAFGYFIEVTKSNLHLVPSHYVRRQTTVNAERYITEELREKEREIFEAQQNIIQLEQEIFEAVVNRVLQDGEALRHAALAMAEIDVFSGWAELARQWNYRRPRVDDGDSIHIEAGRHPVIEQMLIQTPNGLAGMRQFVPNDSHLSSSRNQISLITGPNMAGKSTYIRQVALMALLAQIGCWIPANHGQFGVVDRIFSRIGANDDISRGQSTFMVEMHETANILHYATAKSLVILDEIGRGTSTYDGLSIAWSVAEHLHGQRDSGPKTLFATHYHEMTQLESLLPRFHNFHVAVYEKDDEILFLRQLVPGAADRSYGIQVAKLAGLPASVISRAKIILRELENEGQILKSHLRQNS